MLWFCGINDNSQSHKDMYFSALRSAIKNTTLQPHLIYNGNDEKFLQELVKYNITVVRHNLSFSESENFSNKPESWKKIASGAYLRCDIPLICKQKNITDKFCLYTDVDVVFLKDVVDELNKHAPTFFSICPEFDKSNYVKFNTGVMLINIENMHNDYKNFAKFLNDNSYNFEAFDQGALQDFYKERADKLPLQFNHKPYWGIDNNASIVHYHGVKPGHIQQYLNAESSINPVLDCLFKQNEKKVWIHYLNEYNKYSS